MNEWTKARIMQMIDNRIEENLRVEYKAAASLGRQNNQTGEITKDISAMANGAGGVVIYGISEYREKDKRHLPEKLDPVNRKDFSREWLEQTIQTIQPKIENVLIHSVDDDTVPDGCFYVVEIPQSSTAHQAKDHRYYKRLNFTVEAMEDYEIRDVMNRRQHPHITLSFKREAYTPENSLGVPRFMQGKDDDVLLLEVYGTNDGSVYAQYVMAKIELPVRVLSIHEIVSGDHLGGEKLSVETLSKQSTHTLTNQKQDRGGMGNILSDKRYEPILPSLQMFLGTIGLNLHALEASNKNLEITWTVHADNAPPTSGNITLDEVPLTDKRK